MLLNVCSSLNSSGRGGAGCLVRLRGREVAKPNPFRCCLTLVFCRGWTNLIDIWKTRRTPKNIKRPIIPMCLSFIVRWWSGQLVLDRSIVREGRESCGLNDIFFVYQRRFDDFHNSTTSSSPSDLQDVKLTQTINT